MTTQKSDTSQHIIQEYESVITGRTALLFIYLKSRFSLKSTCEVARLPLVLMVNDRNIQVNIGKCGFM